MQQPMHFDHLSSITAIAEFGLSETFLIFSKAKLNIKKQQKKTNYTFKKLRVESS